ncbi:MAG: aspartate aminotransferase family protein [Planctomycetota bacterium]|nr:aspartate aminotransferase family protein [Planctomycetota bacterium]
MNMAGIRELFDRYVIGNYRRYGVAFVRGEGCYLWDAGGRRYLDLLPGLGVGALGHCHPRIVAAIKAQAGQLIHVHNNYYWESQGLLAKALVERSFPGKVFFCNSGAEAMEAAIKLARRYGMKEGRTEFVSLENCFHGRTYGALSATSQAKFHAGFEPLVPGFRYVPFGDIGALAKAVGPRTAGIIVEPVQGEGGIFPLIGEYLREARRIADSAGALVIYDECQSGLGRTGDWFAYRTLGGPEPDIMALAKPLGGGLPAGAIIAKERVAEAFVPGTHGSTFGGNPIVCAAGLAAIEAIEKERLIENARAMAPVLGDGLRRLKEKHAGRIVAVRQCGLMAAVDLNGPSAGVVERCVELGLLVNSTHDITVRFLPALIVTREQIEEGLAIFDRALEITRQTGA